MPFKVAAASLANTNYRVGSSVIPPDKRGLAVLSPVSDNGGVQNVRDGGGGMSGTVSGIKCLQ